MWRYRFILFLLIGAFFLVVARLFYWQVVKAEELSFLGKSQYGQRIVLDAVRGEIKTSDGFPLATNKLSYLAYVNPKEIAQKDKEKLIRILSSYLSVDSASVSASLAKDLFWVPVKSGIDIETKEKISILDLPGVGFEEQYVRFYPEASMAAHLIGFVGKDEWGGNKGYFGIEGYYDRQLAGKPGTIVQIKDALGRPILAKSNAKAGKVDGRSLQLHIDRTVQFIVEKKLKQGIEKYQAAGGMVAVMDPRTGGVLAMASFPSFDPRSYQEYQYDLYKNPFISNLFEPGSTFKALVMAAGLDAKVVKPETQCSICDQPVSIGGYEIKTWNNKYYKNTTMVDVIRHSDNTGMVFVGQSLGISSFLRYLKQFGIGETTGIDLQGEVSSTVRNKDAWYPIDFATAAFGQGISLTPLMLLNGFAAIANNGVRMEPHVVSKIELVNGEQIAIKSKILGTPISQATAKAMTEILVNAVSNGEAKWAKPKGYRIAGKTGTAQIPIAGHYDPNKTIASFIGFAPADNPKFAMLVIVDRPITSIYGSETAAPIFFEIAKDLFAYYQIASTE